MRSFCYSLLRFKQKAKGIAILYLWPYTNIVQFFRMMNGSVATMEAPVTRINGKNGKNGFKRISSAEKDSQDP